MNKKDVKKELTEWIAANLDQHADADGDVDLEGLSSELAEFVEGLDDDPAEEPAK